MANYRAVALLIVSLLVMVALADGRFSVAHERLLRVEVVKGLKAVQAAIVTCNEVHGVQVGETCLSVAKDFRLSDLQFLGLNPNINCEKVFIGQWVCIDGTTA